TTPTCPRGRTDGEDALTGAAAHNETPPGMPRPRAAIPLSARAVLTVDLAALRANWRRLNEVSGRAECAGVLKADAYGLGLAPIARALTNEGCKTFFVATVDEGRAAREVQPGATIYVLDGLLPGAEASYAGFDLRPVLSSLAEVREWAAYSRTRGRPLPPPRGARRPRRHPDRHRHDPAGHARVRVASAGR